MSNIYIYIKYVHTDMLLKLNKYVLLQMFTEQKKKSKYYKHINKMQLTPYFTQKWYVN